MHALSPSVLYRLCLLLIWLNREFVTFAPFIVFSIVNFQKLPSAHLRAPPLWASCQYHTHQTVSPQRESVLQRWRVVRRKTDEIVTRWRCRGERPATFRPLLARAAR